MKEKKTVIMYPKNNYEQLVDEKIKNLDLNKKNF